MLRTLIHCRHLPTGQRSARAVALPFYLHRRWTSNVPPTSSAGPVIYTAPLLRPFRLLKLFSLTSLALSTSLSPLILIIPAPLPTVARIALAGTAVSASGFSTALIAWGSRSHVNVIRRHGDAGMELESADWLLRRITTTVWDTSVFTVSGRPFATWELPDEVMPRPGREVKEGESQVLAKTEDWKGRLRGQWIVEYQKNSTGKMVGKCRGQGSMIRHFNVADHLIDQSSTSK